MKNKSLIHAIIVAVFIFLLFGAWKARRAGETPAAVPPVIPTPAARPPEKPPEAPTAAPVVLEAPDPAKFLVGELRVQVLSTEGKPIAGAELSPSLSKNPFEGEEGILSDDRIGGGSFTHLNGKTPAFAGKRRSDAEGKIRLRIAIPREDRYLKMHIQLQVSAEGFVNRRNLGQLRLPEEGGRKEITFRLQAGHVIRGKILNLEKDDFEQIWIKVVPPEDEKKEDKSWIGLPKPAADGSFQSEIAPPVPILLIVEHHREKYLPYRQLLHPPFAGVHEVVLQRDPEFKEEGRAIFSIVNPPPGAKLDYQLRIFWEEERRTIGAVANYSDVTRKQILPRGSYQVILMSLNQELPVWAQASFTISDGATTDVPLTLRKSGAVKLRVLEKSSGKPVSSNRLALYVDYMIGDTPVDMMGWSLGFGKTRTEVPGQFRIVTIPVGTIRLRVEDGLNGSYQKSNQTVIVTAEQELQLEYLLEPKGNQND